MANSNYTPGIGGLATSRYDFQSHITGTAFRHSSDQIDVLQGAAPFTIDGVTVTTVQQALETIAGYIANATLNGEGFISVPDGYDTYHASDSSSITPPNSTFPYDPLTPALNIFLDDLLTNPNNPQHHRIRDGGVILIPAGTYKITATISIPPGIVFLGEVYGTKICNAIPGGGPLFQIQADPTRLADVGVDSTNQFMFARDVVFYNLTIADNFVEPLFLGDTSYQVPTNTSSANPLILQEPGSSLKLDNCKFLGKTIYSGSNVATLTSLVVGTDPLAPSSTGTHLTITNCYIDGFSETCIFKANGFTNDTFICANNRIRNYGRLNNDTGSNENNAFFNINGCNSIISNNYLYGADSGYINCAVFIDNYPAFGTYNAQPRITFTGNTGVVNKSATPTSPTNQELLIYNETVNGPNAVVAMVAGNNFEALIDSWVITVAGANSYNTGDFNGSRSIDLAIDYMGPRKTKLYVFDGSYVVGNNAANNSFSMVGIKNSGQYPLVQISTDATSATFGNFTRDRLFYAAGSIEGIKFTFSNAINNLTTLPAVVLQDNPLGSTITDEAFLYVRDCIFEDASLIVPNSSFDEIAIENCRFSQSFATNLDLSLLIPIANKIGIENCEFTNALTSISYGYINNSTAIANSNTIGAYVSFNNCLFEFANGASYTYATTSSIFEPNELYGSLLFIGNNITGVGVKTTISNSVINFNNTNITSTNYGDYVAFMKVVSSDFTLYNSTIEGDLATANLSQSSVNYAMPAIHLSVFKDINILDSTFVGNNFSIQIGANSLQFIENQLVAGTPVGSKNKVNIDNTSFISGLLSNTSCFINVDIGSVNTFTAFNGTYNLFSINDCYFNNYTANGATGFPVSSPLSAIGLPVNTINNLHEQSDISFPYSGAYSALIDIHASKGDQVNITNNIIDALLLPVGADTPPSTNTYNYYAMYSQTSSANTTVGRDQVIIKDNKISVINDVNVSWNRQASVCYLDSKSVDIMGNKVSYYNTIVNSLVPSPIASDGNDLLYWPFGEIDTNTGVVETIINAGTLGSAGNLKYNQYPSSGNHAYGRETLFQRQPGMSTTGYSRDFAYGPGGTSENISRTSLSVSCWVYLSQQTTGNQYIAYRQYDESASTWLAPFTIWSMLLTNSTPGAWQVNVTYDNGGTAAVLTANSTTAGFLILPNVWTHIGFTAGFVGPDLALKMYINGQLAPGATAAPATQLVYGGDTLSPRNPGLGSYVVGAVRSLQDANGVESFGGTITDLRIASITRPLSYFQTIYHDVFPIGLPALIPGEKSYFYLYTPSSSGANVNINISHNSFSRNNLPLNAGAINLRQVGLGNGIIAHNRFDSPYINSNNNEDDRIFVSYNPFTGQYGSLPNKTVIDNNVNVYITKMIPTFAIPSSITTPTSGSNTVKTGSYYSMQAPDSSPVLTQVVAVQGAGGLETFAIGTEIILYDGIGQGFVGEFPGTGSPPAWNPNNKTGVVYGYGLGEFSGQTDNISITNIYNLGLPVFAKIKTITLSAAARGATEGVGTASFQMNANYVQEYNGWPQATNQSNGALWNTTGSPTTLGLPVVFKLKMDFEDDATLQAPANQYLTNYQGSNLLSDHLLYVNFALSVSDGSVPHGTVGIFTFNYIKVRYTY